MLSQALRTSSNRYTIGTSTHPFWQETTCNRTPVRHGRTRSKLITEDRSSSLSRHPHFTPQPVPNKPLSQAHPVRSWKKIPPWYLYLLNTLILSAALRCKYARTHPKVGDSTATGTIIAQFRTYPAATYIKLTSMDPRNNISITSAKIVTSWSLKLPLECHCIEYPTHRTIEGAGMNSSMFSIEGM